MTITAKIIAHSVSSLGGPALVTVQCRYPKFIHGEVMTHRVFSRNASSSRAIPVERLIKDVMDDPAMPIHWGANQKGMSAEKECDAPVLTYDGYFTNREAWLKARDNAVTIARAFSAAGYHKQIVNRLLEQFCHINTLLTSSQWSNFFALRCHPAAQPEMRELADAIFVAIANSDPVVLKPGEWHLPFVNRLSAEEVYKHLNPRTATDMSAKVMYSNWPHHLDPPAELIKLSVARCARVSYLTQDGKTPNVEDDLALYDKLVGSTPLHASPAEHQATPWEFANNLIGLPNSLGGNFGPAWVQYRKTLSNECL